jgi:hypothetical protein
MPHLRAVNWLDLFDFLRLFDLLVSCWDGDALRLGSRRQRVLITWLFGLHTSLVLTVGMLSGLFNYSWIGATGHGSSIRHRPWPSCPLKPIYRLLSVISVVFISSVTALSSILSLFDLDESDDPLRFLASSAVLSLALVRVYWNIRLLKTVLIRLEVRRGRVPELRTFGSVYAYFWTAG